MTSSAAEPRLHAPLDRVVPPHEHGWRTESAHMTSDGEVRYVACVDCGARRVDVRGTPAMPAGALSREVLR